MFMPSINGCMFQSTRPRGRTRLTWIAATRPGISFNPRVLAGGRDYNPNHVPEHYMVSIHASSREDATFEPVPEHDLCSFNPRVLAGGRDVRTSGCLL